MKLAGMSYTVAQAYRDTHPTPERVFAQYHWHERYATSGLGTGGFWDSLTARQQQYCRDAVEAIERAKP